MKEIRLGTIGSGVIVESLLDQVVKTDGIRLTAVYSRSEEKGRRIADQFLRENKESCLLSRQDAFIDSV